MTSTLPPEIDEETTPTEASEDMPTGAEAPPTVLRQTRLQAIERAVRGSVLGCLLQPLLAVISEPAVCTLQMANTMQMHLSSLAQLAAQVTDERGRKRKRERVGEGRERERERENAISSIRQTLLAPNTLRLAALSTLVVEASRSPPPGRRVG